MLEGMQDLIGAIMPGHELALTQNLARDEVQGVLVHANERAAQQLNSVQNDAPGNTRLGGCPARARGLQAHRPRPAAKLQRHAVTLGQARQDRQIEVDDIPAGQHIGIELAHRCWKRRNSSASVAHAMAPSGHE